MVDNRGGVRPTAPQNNPANINPFGGNGQSGKNTQAMIRMPDMPWGEGQKSEDIGRAAPLAGSNTATATTPSSGLPIGGPLRGLTDVTDFPDRSITYGNDLAAPFPVLTTPEPDSGLQFVQAMYLQDPTNQDLAYILETAANQGRI